MTLFTIFTRFRFYISDALYAFYAIDAFLRARHGHSQGSRAEGELFFIFKLQVTNFKYQVTSFKLQVLSYKLQVTSFKLQVISYKLQVLSYKF